MELFFELLLTAAASLLVAFLLARLLSATSDPRRELHDRVAVGPAAVIAEEKKEVAEEEKIIEVDEDRVKEAWADVAAPAAVAEGWVEVEKAPAAVAEVKPVCLLEEEGVPATLDDLLVGAVLAERQLEGEVDEKQCDLAAAMETVGEAKRRDLGAEAAPSEVVEVDLGNEKVQDIEVQQRDLGAEVAPREVPDAGLQKGEVQATEAVQLTQDHLVAEAASTEIPDAESEEKRVQAIELSQHVLASDTVTDEVPDDVVLEKQEDQAIEVEVNQRESAAEEVSRAILDVPLEEEKQQHAEEVVDVHEEVRSKEEGECQDCPLDRQEELVAKEELAMRKADDAENSREGSLNDEVTVQLPDNEAALLGMPDDEARANMEFEEWEGIERSEVEKRFGAAAAFAASDAGAAALSKLDSDVQLQLQGLLKVAVDGPCYDSAQPLTLRPSSRAKWHYLQQVVTASLAEFLSKDQRVAWQKLGNMHPEIAMEKYMNLLSEIIPGWMGDKTSDTKKHEGDVDSGGRVVPVTAHTSDQHSNPGRNDDSGSIDEGPLTSPPNPKKGQSSDIPAE